MHVVALGIRAEQFVHLFLLVAECFKAMPQRALDAGAGKAGMIGVALALDGVVDHAGSGAGAHVHGADGVEKYGGLFSEHVASPCGLLCRLTVAGRFPGWLSAAWAEVLARAPDPRGRADPIPRNPCAPGPDPGP